MLNRVLLIPSLCFSLGLVGTENQTAFDQNVEQFDKATQAPAQIVPDGCFVIESEDKVALQQIGFLANLSEATKNIAVATYQQINSTVYFVGVTTIGLVIYCYCNGKLEKSVVIRNSDGTKKVQDFLWQVKGIPFMGTIMWKIPEELVASKKILYDLIESCEVVGVAIEGVSNTISTGLNLPGIFPKTKSLFESFQGSLNHSHDTFKEALKKAQDLVVL